MFQRIHQFLSAFTARIYPEDLQLAGRYLTPDEMALFNLMDIPTRKHCLQVARTVLAKSEFLNLTPQETKTVMKAALLHDVGKSAAGITTIEKVVFVLLKAISPGIVKKIAGSRTSGGFRARLQQIILVSENHGEIGAELAKNRGLEERVASIIGSHHREDCLDPLVQLVREADNQH